MTEEYQQLYDKQLAMEREAVDIRYKKEFRDLTTAIEQGRFDETKPGSALLKIYFKPIQQKIEEYLNLELVGKKGKEQRYIRYLCDDSSVLAYTVLQFMVKKLAHRNNLVKVTTLALEVITKLKTLHTYNSVVENNPKLMSYLGSEYKRASASRKRILMEKHLKEFDDGSSRGTRTEELKAGVVLLDLVTHSGCDLIKRSRRKQTGIDKKPTYYISFTDSVISVLTRAYDIPDTASVQLPMVIKPTDWTAYNKGGYLSIKYNFMKHHDKKARLAVQNLDLSKPMKAINKLQRTEWRINTRILDVINHIYDNNMIDPRSPPTLPNLYGGLPTSTVTEVYDVLAPMEYKDTYTQEEKKRWAIWNKKREGIQINLDGEKGRRLQYLLTVKMANTMKDYDKFYYVYQLDYRGRVYPVTDFLNPQSKGYVKSLLEFSNGQLLTEVGNYWFRVHIANTFGLDKEPLDDRVEWVNSNKLMLLRVANDPLSSLGEWIEADSPYEFLAACFAYKDYVQGLPVHLPIQLDAVNSGIQMYSGLLRDKTGARSTCVIGSVRADLYAEVAEKVNNKLLNKEYPAYLTFTDKEGVEKVVHTKEEANSLAGKFTRKMTKSNVMTVPYSVTLKGMQNQNWDMMTEMELNGKDFWKGDSWVVNKLWTTLTSESIYEIVQGARAGQDYLKAVASLLTESALWYTPLYNLPVLQPVFKVEEFRVHTLFGRLTLIESVEGVNKRKQLSSIAANYIHSIDATILMYVIDSISNDIGTIHDCFLVHPNQGEEVRECYREGYVQVMKSDPLAQFSKQLDPEGVVPIPYVGDLDLDDVYDSEYIIS